MSREFLYILFPALVGVLFYYYWNNEDEDEDSDSNNRTDTCRF